jgi:Rieske 2Fe-2S family protein
MAEFPIDKALIERTARDAREALTLPADAYTSADVFEWEKKHFFEKGWVCLGRSSELANAGDQKAVPVGRGSVLIVRGKDGVLRGFHNTCRHRGHEVAYCSNEVMNKKALQCPYHSWTYDLEGKFKMAPDFKDHSGFDPSDPANDLVPVRVDEWGGWVFANMSGEATDLRSYLGNLADLCAPWEPERLVWGAGHEYVIKANWKIATENYHECYHCSNIHPELCQVTPPESGEGYEPTGAWVGGSMVLMDFAETMSLDGKSFGVPFRGLNEKQRREVYYFGLFPNLLISLHPDYVMTHRMQPLSPSETWVECNWLFPPEALERSDFSPTYASEFWDITNMEDWHACESVQRSVGSPGYRQGPFAPMEDDVWQFATMVARGYLAGGVSGPVGLAKDSPYPVAAQ